MTAIENLRDCLTEALHPSRLDIDDESHRHVGHPGAAKGGHYRVYIVSDAFTGRPLIARHRMVHEAIPDKLNRRIHALSIVARAPAEIADTSPDRD